MPKLSIIIPHKPTPLNDAALKINLEALLEHTVHDYELIIDTECPKDPYRIWNEAAQSARGEILIFSNSDVIMGPNWDVTFVEFIHDNAIMVGYLVEPGNIGVAAENIQEDFGREPSTFDRAKFDKWAYEKMYNMPRVKMERGWYMPCAMLKEWFNYTGGFDVSLPFPNPNDILFWNKVVEQYQTKLLRANSFAYHFQNLSSR